MRISTQQIFNNGVSNMQKAQTALAKTQEQVSTGKNLNRPSDDPVAAAQILKYRRELAATGTYQENITVSQRRLELEELTLQQVNDAGDRLKELAIRSNNGTMSNENRKGIAAEAKLIQQFVLGLMNTKDAQGEYLFSGAKGGTIPFVADDNGDFKYNGDSEVRFVQTGPSAMVQSTDSGRAVFQVVAGDARVDLLNTTATAPADFTVSVNAADKLGDTPEFDTFLKGNGKQDLFLTVDAANKTYSLVDSAGVELSNGSVPAAILPASTSVVDISPPGLSMDLGVDIATPGLTDISTTIRPEQPKHSILTTAQDLINALQKPITDQDSREASGAALAKVMDELGSAQDGLRLAVTQIGGRVGTLQNQETVNLDFDIFTQVALSSLEDLDYAEALSKFAFQEVALQAAQQTFSRVNNLSLFNYL